MEQLAKLLNTLFFGDGEATQTKAQRIRDIILYMVIGAALAIGALLIWADDEEAVAADNIEVTA